MSDTPPTSPPPPGTDATLATAKTVRSSLIRKSQKEMVRETLNQLLKKS